MWYDSRSAAIIPLFFARPGGAPEDAVAMKGHAVSAVYPWENEKDGEDRGCVISLTLGT